VAVSNVVDPNAQAGVTVFHVAFARWVEQDDPAAFRRLLAQSLEELREGVVATPRPAV